MKVFIQEIEEFEVTDPAGLCNPSVQQGIPIGQLPNIPAPMRAPSNPLPWQPTPQIPSPISPWPGTSGPWPGVVHPGRPAIYTRHHVDPDDPFYVQSKWGVGGPTIQQAGDVIEQEKWERNWQSNQPEICQLSERSKRIMRGEDPDGN